MLLISLALIGVFLNGEIIKTSKLSKPLPPFKVIRDLFSPKRTNREIRKVKFLEREENLKIREEKLRRKHEETFDKVLYEGFVFRKKIKLALLSVSGEFTTAKKGEIVLEKIEIIDITSEILKIKMDNKTYDIPIKGDEDEEQ